MDFSNPYGIFEELTLDPQDIHSSVHDFIMPEPRRKIQPSDCFVCSLVPYGAICTKCNRVQASKAIALATPPAVAWPITHRLGDWEGTKVQEEELLRTLDTELFDLINVPHELDEWGRRLYNDCGHRIIYYQDSDGKTVLGYEAWYPSSVMDDDDDQSANRFAHPQMPDEAENDVADVHGDLDGETFVTAYEEAYYPGSIMDQYQEAGEDNNDGPKLDMAEQQRRELADFFAAQDNELPQFSSDRERVAAWIIASSDDGEEHDDAAVCDREMVSEWDVGGFAASLGTLQEGEDEDRWWEDSSRSIVCAY